MIEPDEDEEAAAMIVEKLIEGTTAEWRCEQSEGDQTYDFDITLPDGRQVALEVTQIRDKNLASQENALNEHGWGIEADELDRSWVLGLKPDAQIRGLREQVVDLLAGLERKELDRFHANTPHRIYRPVGTLRELGVRSGTAYLTSEPSVVIFTHGPGGEPAIGHLAGSNATKAAVREAEKSDNIRKLGAANSDETHLFVFIHYMEAAITALTFRSPPDDKPDLPTEITHLWVAGTTSGTDTYRVWRGSQDGVWTDLGEVSV